VPRFSLQQIAVSAMDKPRFERIRGFCQRFVKQCIREKYGARFDAFHKGNAHLSYRAWRNSPYAVEPSRGSQPNDILYWKASPRRPVGHVAIRAAGNIIVENSIVHNTKARGGKGTRDIRDLDEPDLIVRLPGD
jgi:hypothetical protein